MEKHYYLSEDELGEVIPITLGYQICEPGHSFGPSQRFYYLVHFVFKGKGEYSNSNGTYSVNENQCFVIHPHETTVYHADLKEPWTYAWMGFTCKNPPAALKKDILNIPVLKGVFDSVYSIENFKTIAREWYCRSLILQMFSYLQEDDLSSGDHSTRLVRSACAYIETHYALSDISVEMLANRYELDRSYFCHVFRNAVGKSPQQYILSVRMKKAAQLMHYNDMKMDEIAELLGYSDEFSFSKAFSRIYGMSPLQFRKQYRNTGI